MDIIDRAPPRLTDAETTARLQALASRHAQAYGLGMQVLNLLGSRAENLLDSLPAPVRAGLGRATEAALHGAFDAAQASRGVLAGDPPGWLATAIGTAMGAAGGAGGLATSLAELPVTVTVLMRGVQARAVDHGFDPTEASVRFDCLQVLGSAGPLADDDGAELAFLAARMTLTGPALNRLIASVAPRLATALGQKLAAQAVPVLGAVAGAATNYAYLSYYQDMAHVQFGLRRLAIDAERDEAALRRDFIAMLPPRRVLRGA
jgi:hypothetical protein